jgi:PIN domain nuclease of toxin-antitoxin system
MIVLDTHVWEWWVHNDPRLPLAHQSFIRAHEADKLGVSAISLWEIAMLVAHRRLMFPISCSEWFERALGGLGISVLDLTADVAVESANLPGQFHRDPADRIIVATARPRSAPLVTLDAKINAYPHVTTAP